MKLTRNGQASLEYFLLACVILAAILSSGFINKMRSNCDAYVTKASNRLIHTSE